MTNSDDLAGLIDFPELQRNEGGLRLVREKRSGLKESDWTRQVCDDYAHWHDLVDLPKAASLDLEVTLAPRDLPKAHQPDDQRHRGSIRGLCRADAVIHHHDRRVSLLEAKITSSPIDICQAIGQLLYYKTLVEAYWEVEVAALVCAARNLPPFVLDAVANVQAPIRFLKATDAGSYYGLVPFYSNQLVAH